MECLTMRSKPGFTRGMVFVFDHCHQIQMCTVKLITLRIHCMLFITLIIRSLFSSTRIVNFSISLYTRNLKVITQYLHKSEFQSLTLTSQHFALFPLLHYELSHLQLKCGLTETIADRYPWPFQKNVYANFLVSEKSKMAAEKVRVTHILSRATNIARKQSASKRHFKRYNLKHQQPIQTVRLLITIFCLHKRRSHRICTEHQY